MNPQLERDDIWHDFHERLQQPLPVIPIPLRAPDPEGQLDLQAALHHLCDAARYGDYIL
jgi:hypothetical protein